MLGHLIFGGYDFGEMFQKAKDLKGDSFDAIKKEVDEKIARRELKAWGVEIDELTDEQKEYLNSWEI